MRILIAGAGGRYRTEASLARAARSLGHSATVLDLPGWRRRLGRWSEPLIRRVVDRYAPDFVLCTRHAAAAGTGPLAELLEGRGSAFWYFDAGSPLADRVVALARMVPRVFATYGYQVEAFRAAGAAEAHFLPQGVDPDLDQPAGWAPRSLHCDAAFVGSGGYPRRYPVLAALARACRLQIRGPDWDGAPADLPVAGGTVRGAVFARVVRGAAISLGINALPEQQQERRGGTSNRLWRVLGAGGFFLGERVGGVEQFARDGVHAAWYDGVEQAVELLRQYLAAPERRSAIAAAGRAHALAGHSYAARLALLLAGQGYTST